MCAISQTILESHHERWLDRKHRDKISIAARVFSMTEAPLWADLSVFGFGLSLSPLHIAVLLLLLLGPSPLKRGTAFVAGWIITTLVVILALLTIGHGLVLDMTHGSHHRTGLDLIGGGALLTLGIREIINAFIGSAEPPGWTKSVDRFVAMPMPLLLLISAMTEVISPDDLLLFAKSASMLLVADLPLKREVICTVAFTIGASLLLISPLIAVSMGRNSVIPLLQRCKTLLYQRGELVVATVSLGLGGYLGWQGILGIAVM